MPQAAIKQQSQFETPAPSLSTSTSASRANAPNVGRARSSPSPPTKARTAPRPLATATAPPPLAPASPSSSMPHPNPPHQNPRWTTCARTETANDSVTQCPPACFRAGIERTVRADEEFPSFVFDCSHDSVVRRWLERTKSSAISRLWQNRPAASGHRRTDSNWRFVRLVGQPRKLQVRKWEVQKCDGG